MKGMATVLVAAFGLALATPAIADTSEKSWHPRFIFGGAIGTCTRHDPDVGASGVCGEASTGFDVSFVRHSKATWHFGAEVGFGASVRSQTGDATIALAIGVGGPFVSTRTWVTYDVTEFFFLRGGPEVIFSSALDTVTPSVHGFVDLGSRFASCLELGLRAYAGADGLTKTGGTETTYNAAFGWGTFVFARLYSR